MQLAAAVAFFFFVGRWLDGKLGTEPWLMLIGALIGVGGGLYRFIRTAMEAGGEENTKSRETREPDEN
jgi:F0F1-type ATP synthase assembly protein I